MINVRATKNYIDVIARELLTSGSVNAYTVAFSFDSIWDGLDRTAVFQAGDSKISVILDDTNQCQIPWEVLENPRRTLEVGVYGTRNGTVVLPTVWVSLGEIKQGVSLGDNNQPPTPDVYGQILQAAKDAEDIAQGVRDDADSGKFDGEVGPIGPQGYTYTPAVSEEGVISWANDGGLQNPSPVNIKGPQGKQGIQGNQGKQGERGYVYTPNVSQDGIISWTNDGGLENPGPVDIRGPVGPQGGQGEQGIQGPRGYTYTPSVGEDGTVSWTNDGNLPNPDPVNITGPQGETGETPDITAGTVETLEPGQDATAEITGETPNLVLNLGIPKGQPGQDAPQIDDDVVSATNPWSSLKIVDTLAPPFSSSGAIVTCNPVAGYPLHVVSQIEPVQEGTGDPSPENVRPITGWMEAETTVCGKNLLDFDGTITILQNNYAYNITPILKPSIEKLPRNTPIVFSADWSYYNPKNSHKTLSVYVDGKSYRFKDGSPNELPDGEITRVLIYAGNDKTQDSIVSNLRFTPGSTPAPYEPYNGSTITLPLGQTVYGGTLDWQTGVLTVEWKLIEFDGTEDVRLYAGYNGFYIPNFLDSNYARADGICNFATISKTSESKTNSIWLGVNNNALYWINCYDVLNAHTVAEFKTFLAQQYAAGTPVQVCYKLATPITIQLTPQEVLALAGENTIYTNTGDVTVSGRADPNTIIQSLSQRIAALESAAVQTQTGG